MTSVLHARFPELTGSLPRLPLGSGHTPVRALTHLSPASVPIWVKDEGAYGDGGWGGNKVRKLEWLLADALRRERRTVLTVGGLGTNWGLATACYAREYGLHTALALVDQPADDHVRVQLRRLAESGASLHFTHTKTRTIAAVPLLLACYRRPYLIPPGGSNPLGLLGYVEAAFELADQVRTGALPEPTHIVVPVGSGGTVAGLWLGLELAGLTDVTIVAVVVNDTLRLDRPALRRLARRSASLLTHRGAQLPAAVLADRQLLITTEWMGAGYGHPTPAATSAVTTARHRAGLELEPVYTGKAMAALLYMVGAGQLGTGPVLFLNTHGPR
ncbi:1-aminocyclopropane-1-carboxylate deaminase/D-cysteine desulfhydrase [Nocardia sp. CA-107356]|uniref:1-aminocyclopropane-1-carboxylate deaminase/D-cysteine desulfhydrase n=1 Tax=Nocardia sp. CA-107356 TaxID=3239972 RepID=UPI003D8F7A80